MSITYLSCIILLGAFVQALCTTKVPCDLNDSACLTQATKTLYYKVVGGMPDIGLESSDPLHQDLIDAKLPTVNYTLSDAYLYGMKDCLVEEMSVKLKEMKTFLHINCPKLVLDSNYYIKGDVDSVYVEGKGKCKIIFETYHIGILSNVEKFTGTDGKLHLRIKSFVLKPLGAQEGVKIHFDNLFYGNEAKSDSVQKTLNQNWKEVSGATQAPTMYSFMSHFVHNINKYLTAVSIDDMFFKYV